MKKLLIGILLFFSYSLLSQSDCLFTLNYNSANCFNVQPNLVTLKLITAGGVVKDELVVNYDGLGNVIGTPLSLNGLISWDGVLTGAASDVIIGELTGITESCILTSQIVDNCEGTLYSGGLQTTPINFKEEIEVTTGLTSFGLDSMAVTVPGQVPYIIKDTDTWSEPKIAISAGVDDFNNNYAVGATYIEFPDGLKLCIPDKTDLYTDINLIESPKTITDPDGDIIRIYDYKFDTVGDGLNVNTDTIGGLITVTYGLDWGVIKDSILNCIPVSVPELSPNK